MTSKFRKGKARGVYIRDVEMAQPHRSEQGQ
jgi:hypothetical protein